MEQPTDTKMAAPAPVAAELAGLVIHESPGLRWYHLEEPDSPLLDRLAQEFGFHELEVEDCRHQRHQAKVEEYENHIFVIANTLHFVKETVGVWFGEVVFFVGHDFLVTVHLGPTRAVNQVLPRLKAAAKQQRPDKILYMMLDVIVDRYLPVLDEFGDRIEQVEDDIHKSAGPALMEEIFALKRGLIEFRRTLGAMREMVNAVMRLRAPYFRADMAAYWRDLYDHVIRALTIIDSYRDLVASVLEIYLTATANRTNEIVKVLTIYATIALPLVVVTGYFGMNFEHLPLLGSRLGVAAVSLVMVALPVVLLLYFNKRRWL